MSRLSSGLGIAAVIAVGAVGTLLWTHRGTEPPAAPSPQPMVTQAVPPAEPLPDLIPQPQDVESPPVDASAPPPPAPVAPANDNSTYDRMLAAAQSRPEDAAIAKDIAQWHETFMLAPDDPAWSRPTEQALRRFFQNSAIPSSNFEVTSVACRADRCEVQTLNRIPYASPDEASNDASPSPEFEAEQRMIFNLTHSAQPLGDTGVRLENTVSTPLGEHMGSLLSYRRMSPST